MQVKDFYSLLQLATTLTQNENFTLFIMGFTIPEIKTHVPPNAGNGIKCVAMLKLFISWGVNLYIFLSQITAKRTVVPHKQLSF